MVYSAGELTVALVNLASVMALRRALYLSRGGLVRALALLAVEDCPHRLFA
jgi:hypothetical protein